MRELAELNLLVRRHADVPEGLKLVTDYFREGWQRIRTGNAKGLQKKIKALNWYVIRDCHSITASGMGLTPQDAVVRAMDHALAAVRPHWNVVEVADILSTPYPWFWLARIRVATYRIQAGQFLVMQDNLMSPARAVMQEMDRPDRAAGDEMFANESSQMQEMAMSSGGPVNRT